MARGMRDAEHFHAMPFAIIFATFTTIPVTRVDTLLIS